jgi:RNA-directed DNA polymerase
VTTSGTPQGGVISPLLANIALAGLEQTIKKSLSKTRYARKSEKKRRVLRKINVVRYADDFVVTVSSKKDALKIIRTLKMFLKERGLKLNKEKTKITYVKEGFDFLGFKFKSYEGKGLLVTPTPESKKNFRRKIKAKVYENQKVESAMLIRELNPIITG